MYACFLLVHMAFADQVTLKNGDRLSGAIQKARENFVEATTSAQNALTGIVPGVAVLALLGAAGTLVGIRQRLREYR